METPGAIVDNRESILGLDNIRLDLPLAGVGSRTLAATLDYFLLGVLLALWLTLWAFSMDLVGPWGVAVLVGGMFLLEWGYFAASEILTGGRTLGKKALRIRVITAEGGTPSRGALLARNLLVSPKYLKGSPSPWFDGLAVGDALELGHEQAGLVFKHFFDAVFLSLGANIDRFNLATQMVNIVGERTHLELATNAKRGDDLANQEVFFGRNFLFCHFNFEFTIYDLRFVTRAVSPNRKS